MTARERWRQLTPEQRSGALESLRASCWKSARTAVDALEELAEEPTKLEMLARIADELRSLGGQLNDALRTLREEKACLEKPYES